MRPLRTAEMYRAGELRELRDARVAARQRRLQRLQLAQLAVPLADLVPCLPAPLSDVDVAGTNLDDPLVLVSPPEASFPFVRNLIGKSKIHLRGSDNDFEHPSLWVGMTFSNIPGRKFTW